MYDAQMKVKPCKEEEGPALCKEDRPPSQIPNDDEEVQDVSNVHVRDEEPKKERKSSWRESSRKHSKSSNGRHTINERRLTRQLETFLGVDTTFKLKGVVSMFVLMILVPVVITATLLILPMSSTLADKETRMQSVWSYLLGTFCINYMVFLYGGFTFKMMVHDQVFASFTALEVVAWHVPVFLMSITMVIIIYACDVMPIPFTILVSLTITNAYQFMTTFPFTYYCHIGMKFDVDFIFHMVYTLVVCVFGLLMFLVYVVVFLTYKLWFATKAIIFRQLFMCFMVLLEKSFLKIFMTMYDYYYDSGKTHAMFLVIAFHSYFSCIILSDPHTEFSQLAILVALDWAGVIYSCTQILYLFDRIRRTPKNSLVPTRRNSMPTSEPFYDRVWECVRQTKKGAKAFGWSILDKIFKRHKDMRKEEDEAKLQDKDIVEGLQDNKKDSEECKITNATKYILYVLTQELVEFVTPVAYLLTTVLMFYMPNGNKICGIGSDRWGYEKIEEPQATFIMMGILIVLEFVSVIGVFSILEYNGLRIFNIMYGNLYDNYHLYTSVMGTILVLTIGMIYEPYGFDPTLKFDWL